MAKAINLALSFVLELCLLGALGYWGFKRESGFILQILCGVGIPLLVAVIWGIFLAPASNRRLNGIARLLLQVVLFGIGVGALYSIGSTGLALVLGSVFLLNRVLAIVWGQEQLST